MLAARIVASVVLVVLGVLWLMRSAQTRRDELASARPIRAAPERLRAGGCLWHDCMLLPGLRSVAERAQLADPAAHSPGQRVGPSRDSPKGEGDSPTKRRVLHVLVVDDDPCIRQILQDAMELAGHCVSVAADGAQAVQLLREQTFDVVITDLCMPKVHGDDVVREAAQNPSRPRVIVITGQMENHIEPKMRKLGAECVLRKPFDVMALVRCVGCGNL